MGVTFPKEMRISGYRPAVFKGGLRALNRTRTRRNFIALKSVFETGRDGAIVFEECLDRGLIEVKNGSFVLTEDGEALARGKALKRTPLPKALEVLNDLLDRAAALNSDPEGIGFIDQIWLFGSVMREAPEVGDIDLAMLTSRRPHHQDDWNGFLKLIDLQMNRHPDAPQSLPFRWSGEGWLRDRALFGKRRHVLLSGVQDGTHDLRQMGVPCRLIFDRQRGGKVWDDVLMRHPDSPGRSNEVSPPSSMPGLIPNRLLPMDANWVSGFDDWRGNVHPYICFGDWTDEARELFPFWPGDVSVVSAGSRLEGIKWVPKLARRADLDGRERVAIFAQWWNSGLGILLERQITDEVGRQIKVKFVEQELLRVRSNLEPMLGLIAATVAMIISADSERVCRRYQEFGKTEAVGIEVSLAALGGAVRAQMRSRLETTFKKGLVRSSPIDWSGQPVMLRII